MSRLDLESMGPPCVRTLWRRDCVDGIRGFFFVFVGIAKQKVKANAHRGGADHEEDVCANGGAAVTALCVFRLGLAEALVALLHAESIQVGACAVRSKRQHQATNEGGASDAKKNRTDRADAWLFGRRLDGVRRRRHVTDASRS